MVACDRPGKVRVLTLVELTTLAGRPTARRVNVPAHMHLQSQAENHTLLASRKSKATQNIPHFTS